jgi:hypothetical protein
LKEVWRVYVPISGIVLALAGKIGRTERVLLEQCLHIKRGIRSRRLVLLLVLLLGWHFPIYLNLVDPNSSFHLMRSQVERIVWETSASASASASAID